MPPKAQQLDEAAIRQKWIEAIDAADMAEQQVNMLRDAEQNAIAIREECKTFLGFVKRAWDVLHPGPSDKLMIGWAFKAIVLHLQAVVDGDIQRLLINCPPGFSKSLLTNVFLQAYEWGPLQKPWMQYLSTSGDEDIVDRDAKKFRDLIRSPWYQQLWPHVKMTSVSIGEMTNDNAGARYGRPWSGQMGFRGHRFVGDDPHNLRTAESDVMRKETIRLFKEGSSSRVNDVTRDAHIIICQRVGPDDLSGYIIENDKTYTYLMLPQEFDPERKCITYRKDGTKLFEDPRKKEGELIFPERTPRSAVEYKKGTKEGGMGPFAFSAQENQNPIPRGLGMFKREWIEGDANHECRLIFEKDIPGRIVKTVRAWDLAAKKHKPGQKSGARTAGVLMSLTSTQDIIIHHVVAKGLTALRSLQLRKDTAARDGKTVEIDIPQDPGQAGLAQKGTVAKDFAGYKVYCTPEKGEKEDRFEPFAIQADAGNVYFIRGEWNSESLSELDTFPNGKRKDIADAISRGYNRLMLKKSPDESWGTPMAKCIAMDDQLEN